MVVTFRGTHYLEKFHKQDFFFINFVCQNGYDVLSSKYNNHLHLSEGDCYIGQPYSGYALRIESEPGRGTRVSVTLPVWKEDAP